MSITVLFALQKTKTPSKVFLSVPRGEIRKKWITATYCKDQVSLQSGLFCFEDHFEVSLILKIKNLVVCSTANKILPNNTIDDHYEVITLQM